MNGKDKQKLKKEYRGFVLSNVWPTGVKAKLKANPQCFFTATDAAGAMNMIDELHEKYEEGAEEQFGVMA